MWKFLFEQMLDRMIRQGTLSVTFPDGTRRQFGKGTPEIAVRVSDEALMRRLVLNPDLALGEAYMDQTLQIEGDDLRGLLTLVLTQSCGGAGQLA